MTRVLVVDDSALMRRHLREILERDGAFEVQTARNGAEALEQIPRLDPQVVTLDINMPVMDGLTCLARLMDEMPRPVLMVSSLTSEGALATFEALALGAVDYVAKPGGTVSLNIEEQADELRAKVAAAAGARINRPGRLRERLERRHRARPEPVSRPRLTRGVVLIGVSTGGPGVLGDVIGQLPHDFPLPIVIAQHIPASFSGPLAARLNGECAVRVEELIGTRPLEPGLVLIGRGDADVVLARRAGAAAARCVPSDGHRWHPSVDRLVRSAATCFRPQEIVGVELTGMGDDGAAAMAELHQAGARTIAESRDSAVVFGMPAELIRRDGATAVLPADEVAGQLLEWVR
ncbi:MAG: chemotaxis-specific protein-glutamate methyltransferase CheB [Solirubrobacteraceae bacterium]|jgi:two-component system chemotaxis response regulator CheB